MSFFVAHPVSLGLMTFHEYDIAYKYIDKIREVTKINKKLLSESNDSTLQPFPEIPRFTGDENEDYSHVIDIVDQFMTLVELSYSFLYEDSDHENGPEIVCQNPEIIEINDDESIDEPLSGTSSDANISVTSENIFHHIFPTEEVEIILGCTFDDLCLEFVKNRDCDDPFCTSNHIFPTRETVRKNLRNHTDEQINKAFALVMTSKALQKKYAEVFNDFSFCTEE